MNFRYFKRMVFNIFMELNDILTEDDFEDDEYFEETKHDITNLIQQYGTGTINDIFFHRKGDRGGLIEVWLNGGTSKVQEVVEKLHGTLLGIQYCHCNKYKYNNDHKYKY